MCFLRIGHKRSHPLSTVIAPGMVMHSSEHMHRYYRTFRLTVFVGIIAIGMIASRTARAQFHEPVPRAGDPSRPAWVRLLEADPANVRAVDSAFEAWHADRPFVRDEFTQYYKRFRRWREPFVDAEGRLRVPDAAGTVAEEQRLRAQRGGLSKSGGSGWTFLGPRTTRATGAENTTVTWQTNIYCLDQSLSDPDILYAGGETGGIWRSSDRGRTWMRVSAQLLHGSVRPVRIDPVQPSVVLAGTSGRLVRSTDAGATWTTIYVENELWTHDMVICSDDPRIICAATNKGLLRSTDAGTTWTRILATECWTVAAHPGDPRIIYTVRDSANSAVFCRSTDRGATFAPATSGWWQPAAEQAVYGVRITVSAAAPDRVYALVGASMPEPDLLHNYAGVFVSTDAGRTWRNTHPANAIGEPYSVPDHVNISAADGIDGLSQGFYDFAIIADPANPDQLVAGGTSWWRSTDAGASWKPLGGYVSGLPWAHPDMQWLSARAGELWICSDGGINYSTDFALTHDALMDGIGGSDFWGFDAGWNEDVFVGGRYHNGNTAFVEGYPDGRFLRMGGGEAATGYVHPDDNRRAYFSDIGGYILPRTIADAPIPFSVGLWPNESYYHAEFSGMTFDPRCSGIVYVGFGNGLWRSTDAGASYSLVRRFALGSDTNAVVEHVRIPRGDPSVLYVSLRSNRVWDGAIWRSDDGGNSWTACTPMPGTTGGQRRVVCMDAGGATGRDLWVGLRGGSAAANVFHSGDGGTTWTNLTTPVLAQARPSFLVHQIGTDGGIYLATAPGTVYYRNATMSDWVPYADGLPLSLSTRTLRPFYRDGKIRSGSDMGIWEAPLHEPSAPQAQISVDKVRSACARDTFYFADRSVLRYDAGSTWTWSFPGASHVSDVRSRAPRVVYARPGTYSVTLEVREGTKTSTQTLADFITVEAGGCDPDTVPGSAIVLGGNADPGLVEVPPLHLRTTTFTFSAWVKPDGVQPSYAAILSGNSVEINIDGDNELHYYWPPNGRWWIGSGLRIAPNQWSHVALVATPDSVTLYVNGWGWTSRHANDSVTFSAGMLLGNYNHWSSRYFKGLIDEVCLYDRALTRDEIRERLRLTRNNPRHPSPTDSGLVAYYQFNEADGRASDRVSTRHAQLVGSARRERSTAPIASGSSARRAVKGPGTIAFDSAGVVLTIGPTGADPAGDVVFSRLDGAPDAPPSTAPGGQRYWVGDNYGTHASFSPPAALRLEGFGPVTSDQSADPSVFSLYVRDANADGATWGAVRDRADSAAAGDEGRITFSTGNGITAFGQFAIAREGTPSAVRALDAPAPVQLRLFPTVVPAGQDVTLHASEAGPVGVLLCDTRGARVLQRSLQSGDRLSTAGLAAGAYVYWLQSGTRLRSGVLVLR